MFTCGLKRGFGNSSAFSTSSGWGSAPCVSSRLVAYPMAITEPQLYRCSILETVCAPKVHIPTVLGSRIVLSLVAQCHATQ